MFTREPENERCPLCGSIMVDGRCEDKTCEFHWQPPEPEDSWRSSAAKSPGRTPAEHPRIEAAGPVARRLYSRHAHGSAILKPMPHTVLMYSRSLALASLARRLLTWTFTVLSSPIYSSPQTRS